MFPGEDLRNLMNMHQTFMPVPMNQVNPARLLVVQEYVEGTILAGLEKNPKDRFQSTDELVDSLRICLEAMNAESKK